MAVNLTKYKESLQAAWKDVVDDKSMTNWALFGYEGQSNDLKVVSKGVMDPKTSLPKCVLINWQGEGAPLVRKGTCANHLRDVANLLKGAHVTLNARNEEEVDTQLIIDKVSKSTGSAYSFKERGDQANETGPIGTTYKRVIPRQEINSKERDKFWEKEEQEEKQRQEEERKRKEEERNKLESERKQRELREAAMREERIKERTKSISQIREAERSAEEKMKKNSKEEDEPEDREKEEEERRGRSDILRRQRSQEAQAVISKRTIDARAVFEQNTSAGQMHHRRSSLNQQTISNSFQSPPSSATASRKASLPVWPPASSEMSQQVINSWEERNSRSDINRDLLQPADEDDDGTGYSNGDMGLQARALYDYQAADATEITFDPGDIITHIDQIDEGWWQGLGPDGTFGLFPANYLFSKRNLCNVNVLSISPSTSMLAYRIRIEKTNILDPYQFDRHACPDIVNQQKDYFY
ncbi:Drebrin-like protein [Blattella germanica]|nr:Drebrin-like protein [Blattella germanica]